MLIAAYILKPEKWLLKETTRSMSSMRITQVRLQNKCYRYSNVYLVK